LAGYDGDGYTCQPVCGDGAIVDGEDCDDQNLVDGDGCSSTCGVEDGWTCETNEQGLSACLQIAKKTGCGMGNTSEAGIALLALALLWFRRRECRATLP
jgi:MYXO-CTERM domain-containing protein